MVVVDASAALAWLLPSQGGATAFAFLARNDARRIAPAVFGWEIGNVLAGRVRRGRIPEDAWPEVVADWFALDIALADPVDATDVLPLALAERLSPFDASYLSLALQIGGEIATRDDALIAASRRRGVVVHDLRDPE